MCESCIDIYGARDALPPTDDMRVAIDHVNALYEDHPTGGHLHIVTDDYNVEDTHLRWCETLPLDPVERAAANALHPLSEAQRAAVIGIVHGRLTFDDETGA